MFGKWSAKPVIEALESRITPDRKRDRELKKDSLGYHVDKTVDGVQQVDVRKYTAKEKERAKSYGALPFFPTITPRGLPKVNRLLFYKMDDPPLSPAQSIPIPPESPPYRSLDTETGSSALGYDDLRPPIWPPPVPVVEPEPTKPYRYIAGRRKNGPKIPINPPSWPECLSQRKFILLWEPEDKAENYDAEPIPCEDLEFDSDDSDE